MAHKALIVTGASRGIGAATARLAGRRGYSVCVNYVGNREAAELVASDVRAGGGQAIAFRTPNYDETGVQAMFEATERELGPIAALVNNAGIPGRITRVENLEVANLRETLEVNVVGTALCAREAVRRMSTKRSGAGGAIVNVSSLASRTGSPGELVHYAVAKAGVEIFTYGLAAEVAQEGIRVNCVTLGLFETDIHATAGDAERLQRYATRMPMARPGKPEEAAEAILWLLSDAASYVTGAVLPVGGGR
ncbi:MAG: SDR family oxidoreductase [Bacteroidota bacterium]|jgi:NAD(P)-dependent dehydrogenase (short-subunit alcohol dehydrogenase family)